MENLKNELETYCELYWWNMGRKTLSYKGDLKTLLKNQSITFTRRETDLEKIYMYYFKSANGIRFEARGTKQDFAHFAKQAIQMELVRMGDKSQLYVSGTWRPTVTVNF